MSVVLLWALLIAGGPTPNISPAQDLEISGSASVGSGTSVTGSAGKTYTRRSPLFLNVDLGFKHPRVRWLEFAPTLMLEFEGRVAIGGNPRLRMLLRPAQSGLMSRFHPFGIVGAPVFLFPYKLVGAQAGAGIHIDLVGRLGVLVQVTPTVFFLGDDLMNDAALGKIDLDVGLRVRFK